MGLLQVLTANPRESDSIGIANNSRTSINKYLQMILKQMVTRNLEEHQYKNREAS
jgi:hypothetical protein